MSSKRTWIIKVEPDLADLQHVRFSINGRKVVVVSFNIKKPISPEEGKDLADLIRAYIVEFVKPSNDELIVLSGRGPIWLYMFVQHQMHGYARYLGVFDPKVGIIVIEVHAWEGLFAEGQVFPIDKIPEDVRSKLIQ